MTDVTNVGDLEGTAMTLDFFCASRCVHCQLQKTGQKNGVIKFGLGVSNAQVG